MTNYTFSGSVTDYSDLAFFVLSWGLEKELIDFFIKKHKSGKF